MQDNILLMLQEGLGHFSSRQALVARYILAHHEEAAFLTAAELAHRAGTSEPTVIRLCTRLGFARYGDLQKALQGLVRGRLTHLSRLEESLGQSSDTHTGRLAAMMRTDMASMEKTLSRMEEETLAEAVLALSGARRVFVIGSRSARGPAYYFGQSLAWIRPEVLVLDGKGSMFLDVLAQAGPADTALAVSMPPYPADTVDLLDMAGGRGAATIAVTDSPASPLARRAGCSLHVHNEQVTFADSAAPVMSLLTGLLALVGGQRPEQSAARLEELQKIWSENGIYAET